MEQLYRTCQEGQRRSRHPSRRGKSAVLRERGPSVQRPGWNTPLSPGTGWATQRSELRLLTATVSVDPSTGPEMIARPSSDTRQRATRDGPDRAQSGFRGPSGRSAYGRALGCRQTAEATGTRRGQPRRVHGSPLHGHPRLRASPREGCERTGGVRQHVGRRADLQRVGRRRSASHEPADDGCPGGVCQRDLRRQHPSAARVHDATAGSARRLVTRHG